MKRQVAQYLGCLAFAWIAVGCATHAPTQIGTVPQTSSAPSAPRGVGVTASVYYLDELDTLAGSKKSTWSHDRKLALEVAREQVATLHMSDAMPVLEESQPSSAPLHLDLKMHQFVAWREILYVMLPIPYSSNESACIEGTLTDNRTHATVKRYEEWGFTKTSGFWFFELGHQPRMRDLRDFLVRKVLLAAETDAAELLNYAGSGPDTRGR